MQHQQQSIEELLAAESARSRATIKQVPRLPQCMDLETLMSDETISIPDLAIEGFLPKIGLVLLGGRPKDGKSWFACQTALSLVTGESLGGWLRVRNPGRVQLWALEDGFPLTKDKITKLLGDRHPDGLSDLKVFGDLPQPIPRGGDQIIREALRRQPAELVVLDSLFNLTGATQANSDISQRDYDVIDRVRRIALDHHCAIIVVMHSKKGSRGGDPIENLLGTTGNTAAADVTVELKRTGLNGKLTVVGRMVPREDYELVWHEGDSWGWTIESAGDDAATGETAAEVLAFLEAQGAAKPATIAAGIHKSFGSVWMTLKRLRDHSRVIRTADKRWQLVRQLNGTERE
jgi:hypothetical protein